MTASREPRDDFVGQLVALLAQCLGGFEEQMAVQIEEQIRSEYGGERVYIHRAGWFNCDDRDAQICAERRAGRSWRWLSERYCIPQTSIRRIVKGNGQPD